MDEIEKTKRLIYEIENFDYGNFTNDRYLILLDKMVKLFGGKAYLYVHDLDLSKSSLFRCRWHREKDEIPFKKVRDLWHPPLGSLRYGRANFPGYRLLYTAEEYSTALIETFSKECQYITMWEFKIKHSQPIIFNLSKQILDKRKPLPYAKDQLILNFILREITKRVNENEVVKYLPINILCRLNLANQFDGIIYDSVAADSKRFNLAFKPEFMEQNFDTISYRLFKIEEIKSNVKFRIKCISIADKVEEGLNGRISWLPVNTKTHWIDVNSIQGFE